MWYLSHVYYIMIMIFPACIDQLIDYLYQVYTLKEWLESGKELFGSNINDWLLHCQVCEQSYRIKRSKNEELISQASQCLNCGSTTAGGLYTDQIIKYESRINYVFPFAKNLIS